MPKGVFRNVIFVGSFALKLPRLSNFRSGMQCNRWEREMWFKWRLIFGWENLCPILFSDPFGFLMVMPRATQPVSFNDVVEATPDYYPDITSETKPEDFGRIGNKIYSLDYGLHEKEMVLERRAYYFSKAH